MSKTISYMLERYRAGGSNRYSCPGCGKKKCFTRYVDINTGEYLDESCGKCNHESSCGYHYPPKRFFQDHPECQVAPSPMHPQVHGCTTVLSSTRQQPTALSAVQPQTEFFPLSWAERAAERESTFSRWFMTLPYDEKRKRQVLRDYYVGATAHDTPVRGVNTGPAVIFWMIDENMRVHDAKLMAYTCDGHRVQGWANSMRSICVRSGQGPQLAETEKVFFGLHLLPLHPDWPVSIVESEKTALICALRYPNQLWLSTGGCGNLQASKLQPLMHRRVIIYPDSGEYDNWMERMRQSGHHNYHVVDLMEQYEPNTDIADLILGVARRKQLELVPLDECPF